MTDILWTYLAGLLITYIIIVCLTNTDDLDETVFRTFFYAVLWPFVWISVVAYVIKGMRA